jgi:hypothetical protein
MVTNRSSFGIGGDELNVAKPILVKNTTHLRRLDEINKEIILISRNLIALGFKATDQDEDSYNEKIKKLEAE